MMVVGGGGSRGGSSRRNGRKSPSDAATCQVGFIIDVRRALVLPDWGRLTDGYFWPGFLPSRPYLSYYHDMVWPYQH